MSRARAGASAALLTLLLSACSGSGGAGVVGGIDTSAGGITSFVTAGDYLDWLAEPEAHPSSGPHSGDVRVFFNDLLADSLAEGAERHPVGSAVVKELLDPDDHERFIGHAAMVKVSDADGGDSWVFFEGFTQDDYGGPYYGRGDATCTGCHSGGQDYVLSGLPSAMTAD